MHGLVSLLPQPYYQQVEILWDELEDRYGLRGIRVTPYPHFSWQIAQDYDQDLLAETLRQIAETASPLVVRTTGLGIFTGHRPVIFIPVVKTEALVEFHRRIWRAVEHTATGLSAYYSPAAWIPHISLAYEDVDSGNIGEVISGLAFRTFNWEMNVNNLALIFEPPGEIGMLKYKFKFQGSQS